MEDHGAVHCRPARGTGDAPPADDFILPVAPRLEARRGSAPGKSRFVRAMRDVGEPPLEDDDENEQPEINEPGDQEEMPHHRWAILPESYWPEASARSAVGAALKTCRPPAGEAARSRSGEAGSRPSVQT